MPALALFDLDGTITRRDTLATYVLGFVRAHPARFPAVLGVLPALTRFGLRRADHAALKGAFIRSMLGGYTRPVLDRWTAEFVPQLISHGLWEDAVARIARHRSQGDTLILMSASVDLYVPAIGRALGFDEMLCTPIRWHGDALDGALAGTNLRGAAKARALKELKARYPGHAITAYGNAASDLGHLCLADHGVLVNGSGRTRRDAARLGIVAETWR